MSMQPIVDNILYNVQRQGKISFYVSVVYRCAFCRRLNVILDHFRAFSNTSASCEA
jgi:hypothetical protein